MRWHLKKQKLQNFSLSPKLQLLPKASKTLQSSNFIATLKGFGFRELKKFLLTLFLLAILSSNSFAPTFWQVLPKEHFNLTITCNLFLECEKDFELIRKDIRNVKF